jgi:uroporphyrinogen decarboxylase
LRKLRKKLEEINLYKNWANYKKKTKINSKKDQIIFLKVHRGFFISLGIHDWKGFSEAMFNLVEKPELVKEAMDLQFEYILKYVELIINDIHMDAVIFNEPIGGNEGPLISPKYYEEFALTKYEPLIKLLKNHKIETVILRSYANVRILIPILLKYGFNCLWACETECAEMDYLKIRKEFGRELRLIGGIDLDTLRRDKQSIKKELMEKVPPLLKSGGYIPLADGRIRKYIPFQNYIFYRQLLQDLTKQQY